MKFLRRSVLYAALMLFVGGAVALYFRHDHILDWFALRNYQPPSSIKSLAQDTGMTSYAERLFYVNRPALEERDAFNRHCHDVSDQIAVLGCYTGDRQGIYLYNVTETHLAGIVQVTAAHEMLHQAYDRLSGAERQRIDNQLQAYYDLGAPPALKTQVDAYKKTEPGQLSNEMHSIFGTQSRELPPELEQYYAKYFTSRQKIVGYYFAYQTEFDKRKTQVAAYDKQLEDLRASIEAGKQDIKNREDVLRAERARLDSYLAQNQVASYNASVPGYNGLVNGYRDRLAAVNGMVDEYNRILKERNAIAVQQQKLQQAIDSQLSAVQ